jgi:hypothetical protein
MHNFSYLDFLLPPLLIHHHHIPEHVPRIQEHLCGRIVELAVVHIADVFRVIAGDDDDVLVRGDDGLSAFFIRVLRRHAADNVADHPRDHGQVVGDFILELFERVALIGRRLDAVLVQQVRDRAGVHPVSVRRHLSPIRIHAADETEIRVIRERQLVLEFVFVEILPEIDGPILGRGCFAAQREELAVPADLGDEMRNRQRGRYRSAGRDFCRGNRCVSRRDESGGGRRGGSGGREARRGGGLVRGRLDRRCGAAGRVHARSLRTQTSGPQNGQSDGCQKDEREWINSMERIIAHG